MYLLLIPLITIVALIGLYSYKRIKKLLSFYGIDTSKKSIKTVNIILAVLIAALCVNIQNTALIITMHVIISFIIVDIADLLIRNIVTRKGKICNTILNVLRCGAVPVIISSLIIGYGYYNMGHIEKTEYNLTSDKNVGKYKIAMITDTHYGTIQNPNILKNKIEEINALHPDIVILGGDIVEEGTSNECMKESFRQLGNLESKYGIYYVYGNHDQQNYTSNRTYTVDELNSAITGNNIKILKDEYVKINDDLILAGRDDAAISRISSRKSPEEILTGVDRSKYIIMLDHQPTDAEENSRQGVDLELSGHTHAGQIWPIGQILSLTGNLTYGKYSNGNCTVIVSSGFTGWGYPVRTEEHCEYVIININ